LSLEAPAGAPESQATLIKEPAMIRSRSLVSLVVLVVALSILAALTGCEARNQRLLWKSIPVTHYPQFYTPELKAVVVVPFQDRTGWPKCGTILAGEVAAALAKRKTYKVYGPADLASLAGVVDPADLQAGRLDGLIQTLRARGKVQAVLTGTVAQYKVVQNIEERNRSTSKINQEGITTLHNEPYQHKINVATVGVSVRLIRVSDASELHSMSLEGWPVEVASESLDDQGGPPPLTKAQCITLATKKCVDRLTEPLAIIDRKISSGALRTALWYKGRLRYIVKCHPAAKRLIVLVELPAEADRNAFRVDITRKDAQQALASRDFTWKREWSDGPGESFEFDLQDILTRGGGNGEYHVTMYAGSQAVRKIVFNVEPEAQGKSPPQAEKG
jgi:hypothetical protein